jgi:drug/metabolite transporter (DMT)-like permease
MMSLVPIISLTLGWAFFDETATRPELLGMALALAGISWVVTEDKGARSGEEIHDYRLGIALGLIGAAGQAANLATAKYGLAGDFPTVSATLMRILVAVSIMWLLAIFRGQAGGTVRSWKDGRALSSIIGGTTVGPFLGVWLSMYAVQNARLGIASTLMALPPVLLIPIEWALFGQRVSTRGIVGTLIAFSGVALIFMNR